MWMKVLGGIAGLLVALLGVLLKIPIMLICGLFVLIYLLWKTEWGD